MFYDLFSFAFGGIINFFLPGWIFFYRSKQNLVVLLSKQDTYFSLNLISSLDYLNILPMYSRPTATKEDTGTGDLLSDTTMSTDD